MNLLQQLQELRSSNILTAPNHAELAKYPTLKELLYLVAVPNEDNGVVYWTLPIYDWMGGFADLFSHLVDNNSSVDSGKLKLAYENRAWGYRLFYNDTNVEVPDTLFDKTHAAAAYNKFSSTTLYYRVLKVGKNEWTGFWTPNYVTCAVKYFELTGVWVSPLAIAENERPISFRDHSIELEWNKYFGFGGDPCSPLLRCDPPMKFMPYVVEEQTNDI